MSMKRIALFVTLVVFAIGFGYFGYDTFQRYLVFSTTISEDSERAQTVAQNRGRIIDTLSGAGVPQQQITRGFWYTYTDAYGNESVAYFDSDKWALERELTDQQLKALAAKVASSSITDRDSMKDVSAADLPPTLQFHNALYAGQTPGQFEGTQTGLEAKYTSGKATADELWQLSYMYELQGDYAKRDLVNAANCKKYKARCASSIPLRIHGEVVDLSGRPIEGATVTVLSHPENKGASTDEKGNFTLTLSGKPMEKIRISAVKRNFSEGVASIVVIGAGKTDYTTENIVLGSPISIVTLDTQKHTITDPGDEARPDGSFIVRTSNSTYEIPAGAIVRATGVPYSGVVDVYLYEFTRDTIPQNLMTLDTFDQVIGYAGDLMQSFGMPYIQFFTPGGEELHIVRSEPMVLTYRIAGMQDLRDNTNGFPYGKLTEQDMQKMVDASKSDPGYPVTREFIIKNNLLVFPPFWVFDRKKGVWTNEGMRVLDTGGTIQSIFYTINDQ